MQIPSGDFSLNAHTVATILARGSLAFSGLYFGRQLQKMENALLAWEWYILGVSACCGIFVALNPWKPITWLWDYFDAFSRLLGVPIIATIGLMRATHHMRLTKRQESLLFAVSLLAALFFFTFDVTDPIREPLYLVLDIGFGIYLVSVIRCAFKADKLWEALTLTAALAFYLYITPLDHYYFLPHTDTAIILNDDTVAHIGWGLLYAAIYFAYRGTVAADTRAQSRIAAAERGAPGS